MGSFWPQDDSEGTAEVIYWQVSIFKWRHDKLIGREIDKVDRQIDG